MSKRKYYPEIGKIYNFYTVINEDTIKIDGKVAYNVRCKCGKIEFKQGRHLENGRCKSCKSCASKRTAIKSPPPNIVKDKKLGITYYRLIGYSANKRELNLEVSLDFILKLLEKQNNKCALSGLPIRLTDDIQHNNKECTASLDRINSLLDYTEENVQWVHKDINRLKNNFDQEKFIEMCTLISEYNKQKYERK